MSETDTAGALYARMSSNLNRIFNLRLLHNFLVAFCRIYCDFFIAKQIWLDLAGMATTISLHLLSSSTHFYNVRPTICCDELFNCEICINFLKFLKNYEA